MAPAMPKPPIISAQLAGSGTAPDTDTLSKNTPPLPPTVAASLIVSLPVPTKLNEPVFQTMLYCVP